MKWCCNTFIMHDGGALILLDVPFRLSKSFVTPTYGHIICNSAKISLQRLTGKGGDSMPHHCPSESEQVPAALIRQDLGSSLHIIREDDTKDVQRRRKRQRHSIKLRLDRN